MFAHEGIGVQECRLGIIAIADVPKGDGGVALNPLSFARFIGEPLKLVQNPHRSLRECRARPRAHP